MVNTCKFIAHLVIDHSLLAFTSGRMGAVPGVLLAISLHMGKECFIKQLFA